jgi:putative oxidoreductase
MSGDVPAEARERRALVEPHGGAVRDDPQAVGLLSRLATVPLIVSMTVALLTAKRGDIHGIFDLVGQDEFTYLIVLVMIAVLGPGRLALDRFVAAKLDGMR